MSGLPAALEEGPSQKCQAKPGVINSGGSCGCWKNGIGRAKVALKSMSLMPN